MTNSRLLIIIGVPGCRKDFVAGWLSCLPGFLDVSWRVEMSTGKSFCNSATKNLEQGRSYQELASPIDFYKYYAKINISPNAKYCYVSAAHGYIFFQKDALIPFIDNGTITKILYLNIDRADHLTIKWENYAKNFLTRETRPIDHQTYNENHDIDKIIVQDRNMDPCYITDELRRKTLEHVIKTASNDEPDKFKEDFKDYYTDLDYCELFRPGGSKYLCHVLNITAESRMHDYWDFLLPYIKTPDSIERWGKVWNKYELKFN
jgi:hypothetical protein